MDFLEDYGSGDLPTSDQLLGNQITEQSQPLSKGACGTSFAPSTETTFPATQYFPPTMTPSSSGTAVVTTHQSTPKYGLGGGNQQFQAMQPTINITITPTAANGPSHASVSSTLPQVSFFKIIDSKISKIKFSSQGPYTNLL